MLFPHACLSEYLNMICKRMGRAFSKQCVRIPIREFLHVHIYCEVSLELKLYHHNIYKLNIFYILKYHPLACIKSNFNLTYDVSSELLNNLLLFPEVNYKYDDICP